MLVTIAGGDRDCSSAVISAYQAAGLDVSATYTGNMLDGFLSTGKFERWDTNSTTAQRGDIYLNYVNHTAMCVDDGTGAYGYDALAEFSLSETGGIDGDIGDQTGSESSIHAYYDFPWDCTLHCTDRGLAEKAAQVMEYLCTCSNHGYSQPGRWGDGSTETIEIDGESDGATPAQPTGGTDAPTPRYRVYTSEAGWLSWMHGLTDEGGSGDDFAGIPGCLIYGLEIENLGANGWFAVERADGSSDGGEVGNSPVTGIVVYYDTPDPATTGYYKAEYRVHWLGDSPDWGKWEYDNEDGGAGKDESSPLDMIQITLGR